MRRNAMLPACVPDPRTGTGLLQSAWRMLEGSIGRYFWIAGVLIAGLGLQAWRSGLYASPLSLFLALLGTFSAATPMNHSLLAAIQALHELRLPRWRWLSAGSLAVLAVTVLGFPALLIALHGTPTGWALLQALLCAYALGVLAALRPGVLKLPLMLLVVVGTGMLPDHAPALWFTLPALAAMGVGGLRMFRHAMREGIDADPPLWALREVFRDKAHSDTSERPRRPVVLVGIGPIRVQTPHARLDTRRLGPRFPIRSLRYFLGGQLLPLAWRWRIVQWLVSVLILVATILAGAWNHWRGGTAVIAPVLIAVGTFAEASRGLERVVRLLSRLNANASELALLPAQGDSGTARRHLLQATLWPAMRRAPVLALVGLGACVIGHATGDLLMLTAAWCALALLAGASGMLDALSSQAACPGNRDRTAASFRLRALLWIAGFGALALTSQLRVFPEPGLPGPAMLMQVFALAWLGLAAALAWKVRDRWRSLQRLPHPYIQR